MGAAFSTLKDFFGEGLWPVSCAMAALYVFAVSSRRKRRYLLFAAGLFVVFIYNDLVRKLLGRFVGMVVFYRFLWLLPLSLLMASAVTRLVRRTKRPVIKAAIVAAAVILFAVSGPNYVTKEALTPPDNKYLIADDVLELTEAIERDRGNEGKYRAAMSDLMTRQMRCYDASLQTVVSREDFRKMDRIDWSGELTDTERLLGLVELGRAEDPALMMDSLQAEDAAYVILDSSWGLDEYMASCGCHPIAAGSRYTAYRVDLPGVTGAA